MTIYNRREYVKANFETDLALRAKLVEEYKEKIIPQWLGDLEKRLLNKGPNKSKFMVGDSLTIADFHLLSFALTHVFNENSLKHA